MRELAIIETQEVDGAWKFKMKGFFINPFQIVFGGFAGFLMGGPVGAGMTIGMLLATEGASQATKTVWEWSE